MKKITLVVLLIASSTSIAADELHKKIHEALDDGATMIGVSLFLSSTSNEDSCRISVNARVGSDFLELLDSKTKNPQQGSTKLCTLIFEESLMQRIRCHMTGVDVMASTTWNADFGRTLINPDRLEFTVSMLYDSKGISSVGVEGDCYPI